MQILHNLLTSAGEELLDDLDHDLSDLSGVLIKLRKHKLWDRGFRRNSLFASCV